MIVKVKNIKDDPLYKMASRFQLESQDRITHPMEGIANLAKAYASNRMMDRLGQQYGSGDTTPTPNGLFGLGLSAVKSPIFAGMKTLFS